MSGTSTARVRTSPAPTGRTFNNPLFMERTAGCASDVARARQAGISRTTLNRLRDGDVRISLTRATDMAHRIGVRVDDLFPVGGTR